MAKLTPPEPHTPLWSRENGGGKYLRELNEKAGLTREQLAARVGVSYTVVDNWFDGKNRPTVESMAADRTKTIMAVSGGKSKVDSIYAPLKANLLNILVVDDNTCEILLNRQQYEFVPL